MSYPDATDREVSFFAEHGWRAVVDAIDVGEIAEVGGRCEKILKDPHRFAFDWAWEKGKSREEREFKIVQGTPSRAWPAIAETCFRKWMISFASALMGQKV